MKTIASTLISLMFFCGAASLSLAANEVQLKGTVIKIDGRMITVKDAKGKETIVEGTASDIKVGDPVLLKGQLLKVTTLRSLTAADRDFMAKQCQVSQEDIDVIPQLRSKAQRSILQWIDAKDCNKFVPYKNSRNFYRQLKIDKPIPKIPDGWWDGPWLTDQEQKNFNQIVENAAMKGPL